nr:hypothetical protein GCM10020092_025390 [Actinoplanes digitatis]
MLGLSAVVVIGLGFGLLLLLVRLRWEPLERLDRAVADGLNGLVAPYPPAVTVLEAVARLGGRPIMIWLVTVVVALLLIRRSFRLAVYLAVTGAGALLLDPSLKTLVGRLRPVVEAPVSAAPGNSFPSGHALGSMVVYGALLLVFLPAVAPRRLQPRHRADRGGHRRHRRHPDRARRALPLRRARRLAARRRLARRHRVRVPGLAPRGRLSPSARSSRGSSRRPTTT